MKKIIVILMLLAAGTLIVHAQNYYELDIVNIQNGSNQDLCGDGYDGVIIYGRTGCQNEWTIENVGYYIADYIVLDGTVVDLYNGITIDHLACGESTVFTIQFYDSYIPNPFATQIIWLRQGETVTLLVEGDYNIIWSNGSTENQIEVSVPGIYYVTLSDLCGSETFYVEVRNNVEIESASVDPESNKNLITWEVTPAQAEYISNVIVNRDGVDLVTVPYINGQYLDNIGSDLAARIYTITGICTDGTPCPIPSLVRGTIHMAFLPDINGNVEMTWNHPELGGADIHVGRFDICEYDPNSKGIIVIDFVSAGTTSYSCNENMFDYGYPLIRAVIQDGRGEKDMLSNRTEDLVGLDEIEGKVRRFEIYPNPSNGPVTIKSNEQNSENEFTVTITNLMGQTVATGKTEGGVFTINEKLASGIYFVDFGGDVQKLVVE